MAIIRRARGIRRTTFFLAFRVSIAFFGSVLSKGWFR
jgi:hypothetical protein